MKNIKSAVILALCGLFVFGSCRKNEDVFTREQSDISVSCNEQTVRQNILASGEWSSDCSEVQDWISLEPANGVGDGKNYQYYYIKVAYNKGEARTGTFYLIHSGKRYDVTVSQAECNFSFGKPEFSGVLKQSEVCSAAIKIPYTNAPAQSEHDIQITVSGAGEGLSVQNGKYVIEESGSGAINVPITGTPVSSGNVSFEVKLDGKSVGTLTAVVEEYKEPVIGRDVTYAVWHLCKQKGTAEEKAALNAAHPEWYGATSLDQLKLNSDEGKGVVTLVETDESDPKISGWSFGDAHLYIKGLCVNDYFLFTVDGVNLSKGDIVHFSGSMGGAGSSAGFYVMECSANGTDWTVGESAVTETVEGQSVTYHVKVPDDNTSDQIGAFDIVFKSPEAAKGKFYVRARVPANIRMNHTPTVVTINTTPASTRFKGDLIIKATETSGGGGSGDVEGLPVGWNFYAAGMNATQAAASEFNYSWSFGQSGNDNDSRHPCPGAQPTSDHKVMATSGNPNAWLSAFGASVSAYTFNPNIQCKGFGENDGFIMTIPVKNVKASTTVCVEGGVGAAKAATGNWILEYSSDGSNWFEAPGKKTLTRGEVSFSCHFYNTSGSIDSTRKTYDKTTDDTYQKYIFPLTGISDITDGNLYFRLRALIWNNNQTAPAANTGGWTDVKGFEVSVAN